MAPTVFRATCRRKKAPRGPRPACHDLSTQAESSACWGAGSSSVRTRGASAGRSSMPYRARTRRASASAGSTSAGVATGLPSSSRRMHTRRRSFFRRREPANVRTMSGAPTTRLAASLTMLVTCPKLAARRRDATAGEPTRGRILSQSRAGYTPFMAQAPALPQGFELPLEPRLPRIGSVDQVAVEERAASLARRSIKRESKLFALDLAVRMMDLTTLEGADTPGKVAALRSKAMRPDPSDLTVPPVAAVCVYPNLVPHALERLGDSGVKVASVATAFPSGQSPLEIKVEEAESVAALGAHEIDMVIDRGAFLSGRYAKVYDEIVRVKEACGDAHLKVILETGELGTYDNVRRASLLAMAAGADFIKTSTGKLPGAATLPVTLCMLEAIRDVYEETGRMVGMKPAGGIRQSKQAVQYLVQLHETLGPEWLTPDLYRLGASSLLNDVLMQLRKEKTGRYQSPDYFTVD